MSPRFVIKHHCESVTHTATTTPSVDMQTLYTIHVVCCEVNKRSRSACDCNHSSVATTHLAVDVKDAALGARAVAKLTEAERSIPAVGARMHCVLQWVQEKDSMIIYTFFFNGLLHGELLVMLRTDSLCAQEGGT